MRYAAFVALFALACDSQTGPTAPNATAEALGDISPAVMQVPFKGTFDAIGTASEIPGDRCSALTVQIRGPGRATHLGRLTTDQSHCVDPTSLAFTDGLFTLTAANGDQVHGTYFGEFVPLEPPLFRIDGHFTFTGGTGRFVGASGGGDASGLQNLATGQATVTLEGTISSVGSTKRGN
jgi:hypothetical protein